MAHMDFTEIWQKSLLAQQKYFCDGSDLLYMRNFAELG
jgi:hypothetical protein